MFGSVGRGQQDRLSDLDVLCVVQNGAGRLAEGSIVDYIPPELCSLKLSISWYGGNRIREMFRNGELFAWHLHRETIPLHCFRCKVEHSPSIHGSSRSNISSTKDRPTPAGGMLPL